jgi:hypothetical protein
MRTKYRVAEAMIDRFLKETDPADPQQRPKKDPMIPTPGAPDDQDEAPDTNPDGNPEFDPMGLGYGKLG